MMHEEANTDTSAVWPPPPAVSAVRETLPGTDFVSLLPLSRWVARGMGTYIFFGILSLATDPLRTAKGVALSGLVAIFQVLALVITAVLFLRWTHRAYKNLPAFGTDGLQTTPGWAVGYFFVPLINLYKPYTIFGEIWRASDPEVSSIGSLAWQNVRVPGLLSGWWVCWVVYGLLDRAVFSQSYGRGAGSSDPALSMASDVAGVLAAVLATRVVRLVTARQEAKRTALSA